MKKDKTYKTEIFVEFLGEDIELVVEFYEYQDEGIMLPGKITDIEPRYQVIWCIEIEKISIKQEKELYDVSYLLDNEKINSEIETLVMEQFTEADDFDFDYEKHRYYSEYNHF